MMKFEEFVAFVTTNIKNYLPTEYGNAIIDTHKVSKNNCEYVALKISTENSNICPLIYMEDFYEKYENGVNEEDILTSIADIRVNSNSVVFNTDMLGDFDNTKEFIFPILRNIDSNKTLLEDKPYTIMGDLAIMYKIMWENYSVTVSNALLDTWGITLDELHKIAMENENTKEKCKFYGLYNMVMAMMSGQDIVEDVYDEDEEVFVVTNATKIEGASVILNMDLMKKIKEVLKGEFYILPSSIHEMLITKINKSVEELKDMVKSVNDNQVAPEDRLSYNIYKYDYTTNNLIVVE